LQQKKGAQAPFFIFKHISPTQVALLFAALCLTVLCYFPGLNGSFVFDDLVNITNNSNLMIGTLDLTTIWKVADSGTAGMLKRPISMVSFALNYYASGMNAQGFKLTNLLIHLCNGLLIYLSSALLLELQDRARGMNARTKFNRWVSIAVAAIWLLHPINLSGVLYVVQRMTSLAAFFSLCGIVLYLYGRKLLIDGNPRGYSVALGAILVCTPLATLSKENGALLPLLIFVIEITLLRWKSNDRLNGSLLPMLVGLPIVVPLIVGIVYVVNNPSFILAGYAVRDFSLAERLMTEARVLWLYLQWTLLPNLTELGLYHDDILISKGLLAPWTTLTSILGWVLLSCWAFIMRKRYPLITFGLAFFMVGHLLESTIISLEIAFEHRNYLPVFGIIMPFVYYMLDERLDFARLLVRRFALLSILAMFSGLTAIRANQWGDTFVMRQLEVEHHPHSVRANTDMAALYDHIPPSTNEEAVLLYDKAMFYYQQAADVAPSSISGLIGMLAVNAERKMGVDSSVVNSLEYKLETVPFSPPNKNTLIGLARCIANASCIVDSGTITRIYRAALSNPTLVGASRSQIVSEFALLPSRVWPASERNC
jgi:hypothetical protein